MYRPPSHRKRSKKANQKLNLVPILDAIFILIFFLLVSANFLKMYEISSDVPIISTKEPPKTNKKPLGLTLRITKSGFVLMSGVPAQVTRRIAKLENGDYDTEALHLYLVGLKKNHLTERDIIFEPEENLVYEKIVKIMDAVRLIRPSDETLFINKDGINEEVTQLFDQIIFGNVQS